MDRRPAALKLKTSQRAAADEAWLAGTALLQSGAQGANLVLEAELQRAVHSCRVAGLHRLAAAGYRTLQQLENLHASRSGFRLAGLSWDVYQWLAVAHALRTASDAVDVRWVGEARRGYTDVGSLGLFGLFTEAVASATGYAGVVTYFADTSASVWSLGDVAPGDAGRCRFAYVTPLELGEATVQHRSLSRGGLHLEHARAAANHRLGIGRHLVASVADGLAWTQPPLADLFATSLAAQLERIWAARDEDERRSGDDLVFLRATVEGATSTSLLLRAEQRLLHAVAPSAHAEFAYRQNLDLLSRSVGLGLWLIGRVVLSRPRTLQLLAIWSPDLAVPEDWFGRVNLALDQLLPSHLPGARGASASDAPDTARFDPLLLLARRLEQVLLAGASAASPLAMAGFLRDEADLQRNQLPTAAALLRRLRQAVAEDLPEAWLAARIYLAAAETRLQREAWLA